jgi:hypothetical protein
MNGDGYDELLLPVSNFDVSVVWMYWGAASFDPVSSPFVFRPPLVPICAGSSSD